METKQFPGGLEVKNEEQGEFLARIATLAVIDKEGDVTLPGAFPDGKEIIVSAYGHASWHGGGDALPIGKGNIREQGTEALVQGRLFLTTAQGREHWATMKELGPLQQWSYGFRVLQEDGEALTQWPGARRVLKKLDPYEVSPVLMGAGIDTITLAMKDMKPAPEVTENTIRIRVRDPGDFQEDTFRTIDISKDEGIQAVVGRLKGETSTTVQSYLFNKDNWTVPRAQAWVEEHRKGLAYADHGDRLLVEVADFVGRSRSLAGLRTKEGRVLSAANRDRLSALLGQMSEAAAALKELLDNTEPEEREKTRKVYLEYQKLLVQMHGRA